MKKAVKPWTKVATNILRYQSGTYYLSAKINGEKVRFSLKTKSLDAAKMKRDDILLEKRGTEVTGEKISTVGDALELVMDRLIHKPKLKSATVKYYTALHEILKAELPLRLAASQWRREDVTKWWRATAEKRHPTQANNLLQTVRKMASAIKEAGIRRDLVTQGLLPLSVPASAVETLPSRATLAAILQNMRSNTKNSRGRAEAANMVEFLAWSGLRISEAAALQWNHVGPDWLVVTGGVEGTKNGFTRRVPISPPLAAVIERMRYPGATGDVFINKNPRKALHAACGRCQVKPPLRNHDLRHIFATTCIEQGVDIPTVSKWLGHRDGGALAMKTYGHLRDEHSLASAKKLA